MSVRLVSKFSNQCDHYPPTSQTDRRTTCNRNTALCTIMHPAVKTVVKSAAQGFVDVPVPGEQMFVLVHLLRKPTTIRNADIRERSDNKAFHPWKILLEPPEMKTLGLPPILRRAASCMPLAVCDVVSGRKETVGRQINPGIFHPMYPGIPQPSQLFI